MASARTETSKLFARDIAAYNDTELDQYLEANGRYVNVEDPENLPDNFIQRLRSRTGANDAVSSRPIDLNYVSARLVQEPVDRDPSLRSPSPATTIDLSDERNYQEHYQNNLEKERESYNKLINDSGRPSHPISLGYAAARDLEEYHEILSFWNPSIKNPNDEYGWMVFREQLGRWKVFRESQRRMRTDNPLEAGTVFPPRPAKPGRFDGYHRGLHKRLARHGFERTFQLNEDPVRQDQLTTWIEYLGFEYVEYEQHAKIVKRLQQRYDEAWKKLVDSKVLKPSETKESLWIFGIGVQMKHEESEATKALESVASTVQSAEKILLKAQSSGQSGRGFSQLEQKLSAARSKMATAIESLQWASRRRKLISDFHDQTREYEIASDNASRQSILLRWILQQVPLVELELDPAKVTKPDSAAGNGRRQRSLKRNRPVYPGEEPVLKRQRHDGENHTPLESKTCPLTIQEIPSIQQPRQTSSSVTLPSKPRSQRALRASKASNTKSDSAESRLVLNDSTRVKKSIRRNKFSLSGTLDSRVVRRSSRPRRPPERFQ